MLCADTREPRTWDGHIVDIVSCVTYHLCVYCLESLLFWYGAMLCLSVYPSHSFWADLFIYSAGDGARGLVHARKTLLLSQATPEPLLQPIHMQWMFFNSTAVKGSEANLSDLLLLFLWQGNTQANI